MPLVQVVIGSTRPGRVGEPTARWVAERARKHGAFDVEVVDLAEFDLPMFAEPKHVPIPFVAQFVSDGVFEPNEQVEAGTDGMLDALAAAART